jgi:hypothetical protein
MEGEATEEAENWSQCKEGDLRWCLSVQLNDYVAISLPGCLVQHSNAVDSLPWSLSAFFMQ